MSSREKRYLRYTIPLLVALLAPVRADCQSAPELSHQERFAPAAKSMEKAESDLTAKLAADPKDASLLSSRGLLRLQLNKGPEGIADLRMARELAQQTRNCASTWLTACSSIRSWRRASPR